MEAEEGSDICSECRTLQQPLEFLWGYKSRAEAPQVSLNLLNLTSPGHTTVVRQQQKRLSASDALCVHLSLFVNLSFVTTSVRSRNKFSYFLFVPQFSKVFKEKGEELRKTTKFNINIKFSVENLQRTSQQLPIPPLPAFVLSFDCLEFSVFYFPLLKIYSFFIRSTIVLYYQYHN